MALFVLAQMHQKTNPEHVHIVDTFPVPVCHNIRIKRCKLYRDEAFRGYCASKKQYYFGLKVSVIVTENLCNYLPGPTKTEGEGAQFLTFLSPLSSPDRGQEER